MFTSLLQSVARTWWLFVLRGVVAIAFGVLAFTRPDISFAALVALFGAYALVDGIVMAAASPVFSGTRFFWWMLFDGLLGITVGVLTFVHPAATALSLLYLLGAWLIIGGAIRIFFAIELRREIQDEWFYVLGGVLSVAAGALTLFRPAASAVAWMWVMGFYALLYGISMLGIGIKLHTFGAHLPKAGAVS